MSKSQVSMFSSFLLYSIVFHVLLDVAVCRVKGLLTKGKNGK